MKTWEYIEKFFIRSCVEERTYQGKTVSVDRNYNIVDGMFKIADSISELAEAIREHNPRNHQE